MSLIESRDLHLVGPGVDDLVGFVSAFLFDPDVHLQHEGKHRTGRRGHVRDQLGAIQTIAGPLQRAVPRLKSGGMPDEQRDILFPTVAKGRTLQTGSCGTAQRRHRSVKVAKVDVQRTLEEFKKEGLVVRIGHGQWILDDVNPKWLSEYQISTAQPGPLP